MAKPDKIEKPSRQRLDPEVRRGLLLDAAANLVVSGGLTAVNMERIARDAGVSKALVYSYFSNQTALLSELLLREYRTFQRDARDAAKNVRGLQPLVRVTTRAYLDYVASRGSLIQRLMMEPAIAGRLREVESADRMVTAAFFSEHIAAEYAVGTKQAMLAAQLLMGLTGAAGDYLVAANADPEAIEPLVVSMIMASLDGLSRV